MVNEPVDFDGLLAAARPWSGAPDGTVIGHVHLQVGDVATAEEFWSGVVGLGITSRYPGATFFGSGDYHHHVAANVWRSRGAPPLAFPRTGLTELALRVEPAARAALAARTGGSPDRDPWNIPIRLVETAPVVAAADA